MKRFYHLVMLTAMALMLAVAAGSAMAQGAPESAPVYAGHVYLDLSTGVSRFSPAPRTAQIFGDVYDNTTSTPNFGFSSTDYAAVFGDRVTTAGAGLLDQNDFTVYNSSTGTGSLLTASFLISFYDGATLTPLGAYTTSTVTFTGGLAPGFFTFISLTGLSGQGIGLGTDVLITQQIAAHTGTATKPGIVSLDPPSIGSSANTMYINASTVGAAGFYNIGNPPVNANPGYRINVLSPTPTRTSTWGMLKNLYR